MKICGLLTDDHIVFDFKPKDKKTALSNLVKILKSRGLIENEKQILQDLMNRESLGSTGLEKGIAVPHALTDELQEPFLALALIKKGIDFESVDQMPTHVLILLLGNTNDPGSQLKVLAHICRLVKETNFVDKLLLAKTPQEVCDILSAEEEKIV